MWILIYTFHDVLKITFSGISCSCQYFVEFRSIFRSNFSTELTAIHVSRCYFYISRNFDMLCFSTLNLLSFECSTHLATTHSKHIAVDKCWNWFYRFQFDCLTILFNLIVNDISDLSTDKVARFLCLRIWRILTGITSFLFGSSSTVIKNTVNICDAVQW